MITNFFSLDRILMDELHGQLGNILVVTKERVDAVNFYNGLLVSYRHDTGAMRSDSKLEISCKAHRITVRAVKNKEDVNGLHGPSFSKIYAVGFDSAEEVEFLSSWLD